MIGRKKMESPCIREASQACFHGCCINPFPSLAQETQPKLITTTTAARHEFHATTRSSLLPDLYFTNPESLPPLPESFSNFNKTYPQYRETSRADEIRSQEYEHLSFSNHVCLDYTGIGLFSHLQKQQDSDMTAAVAASSRCSHSPSFSISYNSTSLTSQILYGIRENALESMLRRRIMGFLNISEHDYSMVCTANRASAFKLLAESYPFQANRRLLTVYDYESEALNAMIESSQRRGAKVKSASFSWPSLRVQSGKLRKMVVNKRKKRKRGLFVFPIQSRVSGARYSYRWMSLAQENGWHVLLDACALGPKDMATLGLSLFQPDFLICSFFKVFGENPSGFGCLFVKKSSASVLQASTVARSIGIVRIVPANKLQSSVNSSATDSETQISTFPLEEEAITSSFSGPISAQASKGLGETTSSSKQMQMEGPETGETSDTTHKQQGASPSEIVELGENDSVKQENTETDKIDQDTSVQCRGLDHADSLGLPLISSRLRYLINWLVTALMKLRHPHSENGISLIKIYGPRIKFDRGPTVAFNVFDWKGEQIDPVLVQKLADRSNISLSYAFLQSIWFSDMYEEEKVELLETRTVEVASTGNRRKEKVSSGIPVVTAALGFLANFEDVYRLWAFVAKFLDADFLEKERWRYKALNQKTVEV